MIIEREPSTGMEVQVVGGAKQKSTSSTTGGGGNGSLSKKRSPKSPRKSRPNPEVVAQPEVVQPDKPREKRHHKEKRSHRKHHTTASSGAEQDQNQGQGKAKSGDSKASRPPGSRTRQDSQRRSIRRQSQVEAEHVSHSGRKSKIPEEMSAGPTGGATGAGGGSGGGGVISGAELSDVFDEESQHQYYPEDSDIKYMEDRSNCRKK